MTSRRFWIGPALAGVVGGLLAGCQTLQKTVGKSRADSVTRAGSADDDASPGDESGTLKNVFKPTRRPAGLSSESRDIESSLGLGGH